MSDLPQSYEIELKNCGFYGYHGVLPEERTLGQRFYVDALLTVKTAHGLPDDNIEGTVHYGEAFAEIERIITGHPRNLIETLALDVARTLCEKFEQIERATITIRKPSAPIGGQLDHAAVRLSYPR
ncbi:MAG: dihydroneopterin aldolase [Pseudomonadota bacterium]